jgi:hypothetical protein
MGEHRRSRTKRALRRNYRRTERDVLLLHAVARLQVATTGQLCRLFFADRRTCSRRLAKLHALGLLDVHVPALAGENLYTVPARTMELLEEEGFDPIELHRGGVHRQDLGHLVALNDVRVALVVACGAHPEVELELLLADADLRRRAGAVTPTLVPDLLARMKTATGPFGLAIEIDTGTESATFFAKTKGVAYASLLGGGHSCWGVEPWRPLLVARSARRLASVAARLREIADVRGWLGVEMPRIVTESVLGPVHVPLAELLVEKQARRVPLLQPALPLRRTG